MEDNDQQESNFKQKNRKRVPNFNTISTLIDRLTIESVKQISFETDLNSTLNSEKPVSDLDRKDRIKKLVEKIRRQEEIREVLRKELEENIKFIFDTCEYDYFKELRTHE